MSIEMRKLKPGTALVGRYKDKEYRAKVIAGKDGKVRYRLQDGREFGSPSGVGSAVMAGVACNGWRFWSVAERTARETAKRSNVGRGTPVPASRRIASPAGRKAAAKAG